MASPRLYTTFSAIATPVRNDTDSVTGVVDVDLGGNFTLTSVTGWRTNEESVRQDFDGSSAAFFDTLRQQDYEQFSQELRIGGDISDGINILVGGYYFDSSYQTRSVDQFRRGAWPGRDSSAAAGGRPLVGILCGLCRCADQAG